MALRDALPHPLQADGHDVVIRTLRQVEKTPSAAEEYSEFFDDLSLRLSDTAKAGATSRDSLLLLRTLLRVSSSAALPSFELSLRSFIGTLLDLLEADLHRIENGEQPIAPSITNVLAADYSLLPSRTYRARLIDLVGKLAQAAPAQYASPFLADLLVVHRKMGLDRLDRLESRRRITQATHR